MQMLHAAGIPCAGESPGFDTEEALSHPTDEWVEQFKGGAFKLLNPHKVFLPRRDDYRFILVNRSRRQQAKSQLKFASAVHPGLPIGPNDAKRLEEILRDDWQKAVETVKTYGCPMLLCRFEDLVERPGIFIWGLAEQLEIPEENRMDMLLKLVPRSANCLPMPLPVEPFQPEIVLPQIELKQPDEQS